jgi:hypothetical protein
LRRRVDFALTPEPRLRPNRSWHSGICSKEARWTRRGSRRTPESGTLSQNQARSPETEIRTHRVQVPFRTSAFWSRVDRTSAQTQLTGPNVGGLSSPFRSPRGCMLLSDTRASHQVGRRVPAGASRTVQESQRSGAEAERNRLRDLSRFGPPATDQARYRTVRLCGSHIRRVRKAGSPRVIWQTLLCLVRITSVFRKTNRPYLFCVDGRGRQSCIWGRE